MTVNFDVQSKGEKQAIRELKAECAKLRSQASPPVKPGTSPSLRQSGPPLTSSAPVNTPPLPPSMLYSEKTENVALQSDIDIMGMQIGQLQEERTMLEVKCKKLDLELVSLRKELKDWKTDAVHKYVTSHRPSECSSATMEAERIARAKKSGLMGMLFRGGVAATGAAAPPNTSSVPEDLMPKMQACLEDTLLKNFQLHTNIETLGQEVTNLMDQIKCAGILKDISASATQTGIFISKPEPAPKSLLSYVWQGKHGSPEYHPVGPKPGGTSAGAMFKKTPTCSKMHQGKLWLGKVSNKHQYAVYEKISSDMLQFFGVCGPKTRLASLPVLNPFTKDDEWAKGIADGDPNFKSTFLMSKWMNGYGDIGQQFVDVIITSGSVSNPTTVSSGSKQVPLLGLMRAAAITKFVADTDFLGGTGKNAGYVIRNENGSEYAEFVKIDTGEAFSFRDTTNIERDKNLRNSQDICIANGATRNIIFSQLTADQKKEFLQTMSRIITTPASDFDLIVRRNGLFGASISEPDIITLTDTLKARQYLMITLYGQDIAMYLQDLQATATLHIQDTIQKASASQGIQELIDKVRSALDLANTPPAPETTLPPPNVRRTTTKTEQPLHPP
ncbi:hypothetical protein Pelo_17932 [Pelomyxa schiedti]|nr:hypothetical protein Pelo_17932 [Pelomyxa schiedti]